MSKLTRSEMTPVPNNLSEEDSAGGVFGIGYELEYAADILEKASKIWRGRHKEVVSDNVLKDLTVAGAVECALMSVTAGEIDEAQRLCGILAEIIENLDTDRLIEYLDKENDLRYFSGQAYL